MPSFVTINSAAAALRQANRVLVIGCSGGGKTTLSLKISERFGLDYQSLDRDVRWLPGWIVRDDGEQRAILKKLVAVERWVMDGSSPSTFDLRLPRTDLIIWIRVSRRKALAGLARRVIMNYGRVRVAMAEGCPEPLPDREFLSYIWNFERDSAPLILQLIDKFGPEVPTVEIRSRRAAAQLLV